jgi:hypothetical protein
VTTPASDRPLFVLPWFSRLLESVIRCDRKAPDLGVVDDIILDDVIVTTDDVSYPPGSED